MSVWARRLFGFPIIYLGFVLIIRMNCQPYWSSVLMAIRKTPGS